MRILNILFAIIFILIPNISNAAGAERYIVVLKDNADVDIIRNDLTKRYGLAAQLTFRHALKGFSATIPSSALAMIAKDSRVRYVERDDFVESLEMPVVVQGKAPPTTTGCSAEPAQTLPYGISRVGGPLNGTGKTAWVIDTGIDFNSCDLNIDKTRSRNFVSAGRSSPSDANGHGTHVAGTIAAKNNSIDVVGVAAGATVISVRVLDSRGSGYISWVVAGVDYVTANASAGDVANMSLGATGYYQSLHEAVYNSANAGIRYAIAAGNSSDNAANYEPSSVEHPNVYIVSAVDNADVFAYFSNYGNPPIDCAAPGINVVSLKLGGGITSLSGTSMATPHVTGLLLLGLPVYNGYAVNDPDGNPDPICHN